MDADVIMTLPMQAGTRNIAKYAEPDLQILHHETTSKSTENTYASFSNEPADSDVESGYVEYDVECEMQLVRHVVTTAFQSVTHLDEKHIEPDIDEQLRSISGLNANHNVSATKANIFWRVVKASVPFYIFFFFIYFLLWLSSASCIIDDRTICLQRNNLHYSFTPLLTWTDGPPPT
uniref:KASH domain-containing protein n=1 Tax=Ciona savignyi TaxID=51511 RepID=H2YLP8_CIOSA